MSSLFLPVPAHAIESDAVIEKLRRAVEADNNRITEESLQYMRKKTREKMMGWKKFGLPEMQELFSIASESAGVMKKLEKETKIKQQMERILEEEELALVEQRPETKLKRYLEKIEKEKEVERLREADRQKNSQKEEKSNLNSKPYTNQAPNNENLKGVIQTLKVEEKKIIDPPKQNKQVSNENKLFVANGTSSFSGLNKLIAEGSQGASIFKTVSQSIAPQNNQQPAKQNSLSSLFAADASKKQATKPFSSNPFVSKSASTSVAAGNHNSLWGLNNQNKFATGPYNLTEPSNYVQATKINPFFDFTSKDGLSFNSLVNTKAEKAPNPTEAKANQKSSPVDQKALFAGMNSSGSLFGLVSSPGKAPETKKEPTFLESLVNKPSPLFSKQPQEPTLGFPKQTQGSSIFKPFQPSTSIFSQNPPK